MNPVVIHGDETVLDTLRKMQRVNCDLLSRNLSDYTRGILSNLGTGLAVYIDMLEREEVNPS